jgi:hypothetical protein
MATPVSRLVGMQHLPRNKSLIAFNQLLKCLLTGDRRHLIRA